MKPKSRAFAAARRVIGRALFWHLLWLTGALLVLWLNSSFAVVAVAVAGMWTLFSIFTLYFFRDSEPRVPTNLDAVVSPAHGLVDCVEQTTESEFLGGLCQATLFNGLAERVCLPGDSCWVADY